MSHRKKRFKATKKEANRPIVRWVLIACAALGIGGGFFGYAHHQQQKYGSILEERLAQRQKIASKGGVGPSFFPSSSRSLIMRRYLDRLEEMEENFLRDGDVFYRFLDKNRAALLELTDSCSEDFGTIEKRRNGFEIKSDSGWMTELERYLTEVCWGDFTHKEKFIELASMYWESASFSLRKELSMYGVERQRMLQFTSLAEHYHSYLGLPEEEKKKFSDVIVMDSEGNLKNAGKTEEMGKAIMGFFETMKKQLPLVSPHRIDLEEIVRNKRLWARFHTHPKEDKYYEPSPLDEANTCVLGPGVLFSQSKGVLHVYMISEGKSKEIYTSPIK